MSKDHPQSRAKGTGGAPRIYSDEQIERALIDNHGLISPAARQIGCSVFTLRDRIKADPSKWQPIIDELRSELVDAAEGNIHTSVKGGDVGVSMWVLRTIGKHRGYVERQEVTGANGGPVVVDLTGGD